MNSAVIEPAVRARLLSEQLEDLRVRFAEGRATLREVVTALGSRAFALLMILFALPFVAPVSVPGSSTPLGLIIAAIAVQLALGRLPWLPRRLLAWRLPAGFFTRLIPVTERIVRRLERVLHPRWPRITGAPWLRAVHLLVICAAALLLALPLPIPLTNTFPAWSVLLLGCGLLERDGVFIVAGHAAFVATLVFLGLLGGALTEGLLHSWHWAFG